MTSDVYTPAVGAFATAWAAITTADATVQAAVWTCLAVIVGAGLTAFFAWRASRALARLTQQQLDLAKESSALQLDLAHKSAVAQLKEAKRNRRLELLPRRWDMFKEFLNGARSVRALIGHRGRHTKPEIDKEFEDTFRRLYVIEEDMRYIFGPDLSDSAAKVLDCLENLLRGQETLWSTDPRDNDAWNKAAEATKESRLAATASLSDYFAAGRDFLDFSADKLSNEEVQSVVQLKAAFDVSDAKIQARSKPPGGDGAV